MKKKALILIGGGGHGKVVADAIKCSGKFDIHGIIDPALKKGDTVLGIEVLGGDEILKDIYDNGIKYAFIGIGSIGDCSVREKVYTNLKDIGFELPVITHPSSVIAKDVRIDEGTFIAAGSVINPGTVIGKNVIVNTSTSIDHDCKIGDFVHIAPGVTLSGGVKVGYSVHIGTGTNVIQCITIGKRAFIPAGETAIKNVADNEKYSGYSHEKERL